MRIFSSHRRRLFGWVRTLGWVYGCMFAATAYSAAPPPEWHEFTNASGQKINAQIINVVEPDVHLQREDKQNFKADITIFSPEDQTYIRAWSLKQLQASGAKLFRIVATETKSSPKVTMPKGWINTTWDASYNITVESHAKVQVADIQAAYIILVKEVSWKGEEKEVVHTGKSRMPPLAPGAKESFSTDGVGLRKQVVAPGFASKELPKGYALDDLVGVWVRLYASDGTMLQEWKSAEDKLKMFSNSEAEKMFKDALNPTASKKR